VFDFFVSGGAGAEKTGRGERTAPRQELQQWGPSADHSQVVSLTQNKRVETLLIDRRFAPGFGEFLLSRMDELFTEYSLASGDEDFAVDQRGKKAASRR
jgi:hypothetical protein